MGKKIMILSSSPRAKGNTNTVVGWVSQGARAAGAEVDIIDTAKLDYGVNGCTACMGCQKSDKYECVIKDEASPLIARVPEYEVLVLASPIYFFGVNAQLKLFMDRMYSLAKFNPATGEMTHRLKRGALALIATAGGGLEDGLGLAEQTVKAIAGFTGSQFESLLVPSAPHEAGDIAGNTELKDKSITFGGKLAGVQ